MEDNSSFTLIFKVIKTDKEQIKIAVFANSESNLIGEFSPSGDKREVNLFGDSVDSTNENKFRIKEIWRGAFDSWYVLYPRKVARGRALSAWDKFTPKAEAACEARLRWITGKLQRYIEHEFKDRLREHIPYPATWLHDMLRELEYETHKH